MMKENDQLFQVFSKPRVLLAMAFDVITDNDFKEYYAVDTCKLLLTTTFN